MALSRYQKQLVKIAPTIERFTLEKITVHTGLNVFSCAKSDDVLRAINRLHAQMIRTGGYLTISEGNTEVTAIADATFAPLLQKLLGRRITHSKPRISALVIHFPAKYIAIPGMLCMILQQVMLQGINVLEVASTYTEFVLYIAEDDTRLAFDTLYRLFDVGG